MLFDPAAAFDQVQQSQKCSYHRETFHTGFGALDILIAPSSCTTNARPLVAVHGISRDPVSIITRFSAAADRMIIAPIFDATNWPRYQRLNRSRSDRALLEALLALRDRGVLGAEAPDFFGFSGGAQFAHRFAMAYPQMVGALHVASAGWYTLPDEGAVWPYGLGGGSAWSRRLSGCICRYLALPMRIYVGDRDTESDPSLRRNTAVDRAQGVNRVERAQAFIAAVAEAAALRGVSPDVTLTMLPGCGHDFLQCDELAGLARKVCAGRPPVVKE